MTESKSCSRCQRMLPMSCFVFETARQRYRTVCKQCRASDQRRAYSALPERQAEYKARALAQRTDENYLSNLRAQRKQAREELSDGYITRLLTKGQRTNAGNACIPQSLIDLKRTHLQLTRHLNQLKGQSK